MTKTATLVAEALPQFCPTTNHYECSDGIYLLVSIPSFDPLAALENALGIKLAVAVSQLPAQADVFLADAVAAVLDANGDPADGLTPLLTIPDCQSFETALAVTGYVVEERH